MSGARSPRVLLITTGGTIAMRSGPHGAVLSAGDDGVPKSAIGEGVQLETLSLFQKPSCDIGLAEAAELAAAIDAAAPGYDGVVVSHGTDTVEETAFALSLLLKTDIPVVLTGAMRSADSPGSDGEANLAAAVLVAASPEAVGKGVLLVMGDEIHAAQFVRKVHTSQPHAFSSAPLGPLGWCAEQRVWFGVAPVFRPPRLVFGGRVPVIPILEVHGGFEPAIIEALATAPIDGLVLSLPGGGHIAGEAVEPLAALSERSPVILASRTRAGEMLRATYGYRGGDIDLAARGLITAGFLDPLRARIALALLLSAGAGRAEAIGFFDGFRGR